MMEITEIMKFKSDDVVIKVVLCECSHDNTPLSREYCVFVRDAAADSSLVSFDFNTRDEAVHLFREMMKAKIT